MCHLHSSTTDNDGFQKNSPIVFLFFFFPPQARDMVLQYGAKQLAGSFYNFISHREISVFLASRSVHTSFTQVVMLRSLGIGGEDVFSQSWMPDFLCFILGSLLFLILFLPFRSVTCVPHFSVTAGFVSAGHKHKHNLKGALPCGPKNLLSVPASAEHFSACGGGGAASPLCLYVCMRVCTSVSLCAEFFLFCSNIHNPFRELFQLVAWFAHSAVHLCA